MVVEQTSMVVSWHYQVGGIILLCVIAVSFVFLLHFCIDTELCHRCKKKRHKREWYGEGCCSDCKKYRNDVGPGLYFGGEFDSFEILRGNVSESKISKIKELTRLIEGSKDIELYVEIRDKVNEMFKRAREIEESKKKREIYKIAKDIGIELKGGNKDVKKN